MPEQSNLDTDKLQEIREKYLAPAFRELEAIAATRPKNGELVTMSKNNVRYAFNDLGHAIAVTKGLDPMANRVERKEQ